jgi:hypothetical protein
VNYPQITQIKQRDKAATKSVEKMKT